MGSLALLLKLIKNPDGTEISNVIQSK